MGSNDVVSIRVEALGVSITIADGSIAIEQTKMEIPAATVAEGPAAARRQFLPEPLPERVDNSAVRGDSDAENSAPAIDEFHRPSLPGSNGPTELAANSGEQTRSSQTKPLWSDEEVEKLRALYPTHSASAIATELGRGRNSVRSKAQNLGLRKAPSPQEAKPTPKPKSLSAAVTTDSTAPDGFRAVSLLDHHLGQCRWIVSDVWPVM
jgi:hypothetical protein